MAVRARISAHRYFDRKVSFLPFKLAIVCFFRPAQRHNYADQSNPNYLLVPRLEGCWGPSGDHVDAIFGDGAHGFACLFGRNCS